MPPSRWALETTAQTISTMNSKHDQGPDASEELPPHSIEAEQGVLGCAFLEPGVLITIAKRVSPEVFFDLRHRTVYELLLEMHGKEAIDMITVQNKLKARQQVEAVGGLPYLASLPDQTPSAANLGYYLEIVADKYAQRRAIASAYELACRIKGNPENTSLIIAGAEKDFAEIRKLFTPTVLAAKSLSDFVRPIQDDPAELLKFGYLRRRGGLLWVGPTGIGKSVAEMQAAILWGMERSCFGIVPTKPLKSVIIQAENDDGDIAEMRDGILKGFNLENCPGAVSNVLVFHEAAKTASRFLIEVVRPLLEQHRPDLLWIDPALSYLGGSASKQEDVGPFLRNGLNPLIHEFDCAAVIMHHTPKPPKADEKGYIGSDVAYSGTGSIEWANWARAVLVLKSDGKHDAYKLVAAKRGSRLGWKDAQGERILRR